MSETSQSPAPSTRPLLLIAAVLGLLVAGTVALWAHYGSTVFFEMIVAGINACF